LSTEATIFVGVAIYFVIMLYIGMRASKKAGTTEDFIVAGRGMPIWIASATRRKTSLSPGAACRSG